MQHFSQPRNISALISNAVDNVFCMLIKFLTSSSDFCLSAKKKKRKNFSFASSSKSSKRNERNKCELRIAIAGQMKMELSMQTRSDSSENSIPFQTEN